MVSRAGMQIEHCLIITILRDKLERVSNAPTPYFFSFAFSLKGKVKKIVEFSSRELGSGTGDFPLKSSKNIGLKP